MLLDVLESAHVILSHDKVDGDSLTTESTTTTDSVEVVLNRSRQVIVDDQGNLLDIDTSGQQIGGDKNTARTGSELTHDEVSLLLIQIGVHARDGVVVLVHLVGQVVDLLTRVAVDDGLSDGQGLIQILQGVELPLLLLNGDVELSDTFQGKLGGLNQNSNWVTHELAGQLDYLLGHGGREKSNLDGARQQLEHVIYLLLETVLKHLISLVNNEDLKVIQLQRSLRSHVVNTAGSSDNQMLTLTELLNILSDGGTTDASVAADLHVVTQRLSNSHDLLSELSGGSKDQSLANLLRDVDLLQTTDHESTGLTSTGLGLTDSVTAHKNGSDGSLLNGRGLLETVRVDTTEEVLIQIEVVEGLDGLVILLIGGHFAKGNFFVYLSGLSMPKIVNLADFPRLYSNTSRIVLLSFMGKQSEPVQPTIEKENNSSENMPSQSPPGGKPNENVTSTTNSLSPNALRKRRREAIAKKVEARKQLITAANSTHLDMTKVHSILSGPRLSWDWHGKGASKRDAEGAEDDDSCGLVVDFHQDSRSALKTHISKAMSQMASKDISSQSIPAVKPSRTSSEEIKQIIQMKRRLISSQATQINKEPVPERVTNEDEIGENLPVLEPIHHWQETQMPTTQVFVRVDSPFREKETETPPVEEEINMDDDFGGSTQIYIPPTVQEEPEATQVYIRTSEEPSRASSKAPRLLRPQISKASSTISIPENTVRQDEGSASSGTEEVSEESSASSVESPPAKHTKKSKQDLSFEEWLEARKQRKKAIKKQSKEARAFFEAEAEESEDEELGGIVRRTKEAGEGASEDDSDSSSEDSDLEDLVASARDEFDLLQKTGKDKKKLAKLHAKWLEEKDAELEKAIEDRNFWRKQRSGLRGLDDDGQAGGLNRLQRKLKAKQDKYDADGNLLAPEYVSESDYDSMDIDSDEFFDEFSDEDGQEEQLDEEELALRRERKAREKERRKKDLELKLEMQKRRQLLKAKLREERLNREKDKREIQAGVGIMPEEDRETFKLVNRTQGVFGYTQATSSGITTQSTSASASSLPSPTFSFLKSTEIKTMSYKPRRSSIGSLELE